MTQQNIPQTKSLSGIKINDFYVCELLKSLFSKLFFMTCTKETKNVPNFFCIY